jgi:hypothetical protein
VTQWSVVNKSCVSAGSKYKNVCVMQCLTCTAKNLRMGHHVPHELHKSVHSVGYFYYIGHQDLHTANNGWSSSLGVVQRGNSAA